MKELQKITVKLQQFIENKGYTLEILEEDLGWQQGRLQEVIAGSELTGSEIEALARILHMTREQRDEILL